MSDEATITEELPTEIAEALNAYADAAIGFGMAVDDDDREVTAARRGLADAILRRLRSPPSDGARGECTVCGHAGLLQTQDHLGPDGAICLGSGCLPKSAPDGARDEEIERLKAEVARLRAEFTAPGVSADGTHPIASAEAWRLAYNQALSAAESARRVVEDLAKRALAFARGAEVRSWPPGHKMREDLIATCKHVLDQAAARAALASPAPRDEARTLLERMVEEDGHIRACGNGGEDPEDCSPLCVQVRALLSSPASDTKENRNA